ncbi:MAG: hypothetical protein ACPGQS_02945, partial [Bradymonadia bacterium]
VLGEELIDASVQKMDMLLQQDASPSRLEKVPSVAKPGKTRPRTTTVSTAQPVKSKVAQLPAQGRRLATAKAVENKPKSVDVASVIPDAGIGTRTLDATLADAARMVAENKDKPADAATESPPQVPAISFKVPGSVVRTKARTLTPGTYQLSDRGDLFKLTIDELKLFLRLSAPRGRFLLSANASPWANIMVDGRKLGGTPLAAFPLTPGRHTLVFSTAKGKQVALSFELVR